MTTAAEAQPATTDGGDDFGPRYKWLALSNTSLGVFIASVDASIVIISMPAIFRGIGLDPLGAGNIGYLLWMIMGYMLVTAVLVVTIGRLGDMLGRVRIYNLGFVVFTVASVLLSVDPYTGEAGAMWLIGFRVVQGIGGAMLMANSAAILVDAFPANQRGMALGTNTVAALSGQFIGLVAGGLLSEWDWRAVFWVNVPIGIVGTVWAYRSLRDNGVRNPGRIDWLGNITFGLGLSLVLVSITFGIQPYEGHTMGWTSPRVIGLMTAGLVLMAAFVTIELHVKDPMFHLKLFKIRTFAAGNVATLLLAISRGGLQFMLVIWLQGIWLPLHGYDFEVTPLWAGIFLLPLTFGFLVSGPVAGFLSDRFDGRWFSGGGALLFSISCIGMLLLPLNFSYYAFAILIFLSGVGSGMFGAPNSSAVMSAVPPEHRGAASGMRSTFQNSGSLLSIGIFFSILISGLASTLPQTLTGGLVAQGVPTDVATQVGSLPPVSTVFAAFLGYNPIENLLAPTGVLGTLPQSTVDTLTGREFFPNLISDPFHHGLGIVFLVAAVLGLLAGAASIMKGKRIPAAV